MAEGQLAGFLKLMSRFREYSLYNTRLIYRQHPDATMMAGIKPRNSVTRFDSRGGSADRLTGPRFW